MNQKMEIKQFEDKGLSHYSYAIMDEGEIALIDPSRNPQDYYDFAQANNAKITAIIETHPHADFVSGHLEISKHTGAQIYVSKLLGADYKHETFDDGDEIQIGKVSLRALNTPGHSPDSISIVLSDEDKKDVAVFTGDTLFIGDCGRPDLRENTGAIQAERNELARQMYHSLRKKLMTLDDSLVVYPAHGAGSLCGKALSKANSSTIGAEKSSNWCMQDHTEDEFISALLENQPFIPKYFAHAVNKNKEGAADYIASIEQVSMGQHISSSEDASVLDSKTLIIDTRDESDYKKGHLPHSINLMNGGKFETWLGSIISPEEPFYLAAANEEILKELITKIAKIGYENQIKKAFVISGGPRTSANFDSKELERNPEKYTIVDIRNPSETSAGLIFKDALTIPLFELRERSIEIPANKPIVVHCAAGYRSAAGSSILKNLLPEYATIYDLGTDINNFR